MNTLSSCTSSRSYERHGCSREPLYGAWRRMIDRCHLPTSDGYHKYGGRGIYVCDRWRESFLNFLKDMGPRPEGMTLDRIDNDGPYCPENCRWATARQQSDNRRITILLTYAGKTQSLVEWAEEFNMKPVTLRSRLVRYDWDIEKSLSEPIQYRSPNGTRQPRKKIQTS